MFELTAIARNISWSRSKKLRWQREHSEEMKQIKDLLCFCAANARAMAKVCKAFLISWVKQGKQRTSKKMHLQIGHISNWILSHLAPPPTEDFIQDHCFNLMVLSGPHSSLSSRPPQNYLGCFGSLLSLLYSAGLSYCPFFAQTTTKQNRAFSVFGPSF